MELKTKEFSERPVGELVSEDYRRADIFKANGIDFCCGGKKSVQQACEENGVDPQHIVNALNDLSVQPTGPRQDFRKWELDFTCDYIVNTHHAYVNEAITQIKLYLEKVARVHGGNNPELHEVRDAFETLAGEMTAHMKKEELILFPQIKKMVAAKKQGQRISRPPFGSISNPINAMEAEHEGAGNLIADIRKLTHDFTPPAHACATYRVSFASLQQFEEDLHRHVHLENNILFPAALKLETELFGDDNKGQN